MTATIQNVPLSQLQRSPDNPRTVFNAQRIEELAATILKEGVLQNLVVKRAKGRKVVYTVVAGERRLRALEILHERGDVPPDYPVPVLIRSGLSDTDALQTATVENVQREPLEPLDEAHAYAKLLRNGTEAEDLSAESGVSITTIRRRLALISLCDEAQTALRDGFLTLAQAEALTLGSSDAQRRIVEEIVDGYGDHYTPKRIKDYLLIKLFPVSVAMFPRDHYEGTYTTDLFGDDANTYFDDAEGFWILQRQAVTELAEQYRAKAEWVESIEDYSIPRWQYDEAGADEPGGVVINLSPTGEVEIVERLVKRLSSSELAGVERGNPNAPKTKPAYSAPLRRLIAHHKSLAVQAALLDHPRKAKEIAVIMMMGGKDGWDRPIELTPHAGLQMPAEPAEAEAPAAFAALEVHGKTLAAQISAGQEESDGPVWERFFDRFLQEPATLYDAVSRLSDEDLNTLHLLLPVLCFGQSNCDELDTGESLFNRVARELEVDMRQWWRPDEAFLKRRNKAQLLEIAEVSGAVDTLGPLGKHTKAELVTTLCQHFEGETEAARNWLPGAMQFPAVEQDGSAETAEADSGMDTAAA